MRCNWRCGSILPHRLKGQYQDGFRIESAVQTYSIATDIAFTEALVHAHSVFTETPRYQKSVRSGCQ